MKISLVKIAYYCLFLVLIPVIYTAQDQMSIPIKFDSSIGSNYDVRRYISLQHDFTVNRDEGQDIITILSTDLSTGKDPDDWIDTYLFLSHSKLNPSGIILDTYATDKVEKKAKKIFEILDKEHIPIVRGIQEKIIEKEGELITSQYKAGAEFILEKMKETAGKVNLFAVGSLRNEALAYHMNPKLFTEKIGKLYWAGGSWGGKGEANLNRDRLAVRIIANSDIPKVWIPCVSELKQKLTGQQEKLITKEGNNLTNFYQKLLIDWREYRSSDFLERTNQTLGEGKNLWSLPIFLKVTDQDNSWLSFVRGTMHYDEKQLTWFEENQQGKDLMLEGRKEKPITDWAVKKVLEFD